MESLNFAKAASSLMYLQMIECSECGRKGKCPPARKKSCVDYAISSYICGHLEWSLEEKHQALNHMKRFNPDKLEYLRKYCKNN